MDSDTQKKKKSAEKEKKQRQPKAKSNKLVYLKAVCLIFVVWLAAFCLKKAAETVLPSALPDDGEFLFADNDDESVTELGNVDEVELKRRKHAEDMLDTAKADRERVRFSLETDAIIDDAATVKKESVALQIENEVMRGKMSEEKRQQLLADREKIIDTDIDTLWDNLNSLNVSDDDSKHL